MLFSNIANGIGFKMMMAKVFAIWFPTVQEPLGSKTLKTLSKICTEAKANPCPIRLFYS